MSLIKTALDRHASNQAKRFLVDRSQTIGASEIGQCSRKVFYLKNENDPSHAIVRDEVYFDEWGARMRGTVFEDFFWVPAMQREFGEQLMYAGVTQETFVDGFLSATPDGMLVGLDLLQQAQLGVDTDCVMVECKTVDPRTNLTEAKDENVYQTQVQMGLVRSQTLDKPTHSVISYTDASWWNIIHEYVVPFDEAVFEGAKVRALRIMTADHASELKPEGWIAGGRECRYCPFTGACGIERKNVPYSAESAKETLDRIGSQVIAELTDLAAQTQAWGRECDIADEAYREAQEALKQRMRDLNIRSVPGVVSWSPVKGRAGYDMKALREAATAAGVDIEQFATEGEPGERLTIRLASRDASGEENGKAK